MGSPGDARAPLLVQHFCCLLNTSTPLKPPQAWDHRVTPVRRGSRNIIKFAYTSSHVRLPAFAANLEREAYAS